MISDYPKDKVEWVIVEDSDPAESSADRVAAVAAKSSPLKVVYVPLGARTSVGEKRNIGVAAAEHDIVLMMDDDDHYPETSFRRRVAWLTGHSWKPNIVGCTTIACYDLLKGISAVNSPPMIIPLAQRLSEATLAFYKSWWAKNKFDSAVQIGEGESILAGREGEFLEIAPQQIIVAFSHNKNASSRRIPSSDDVKPGCFWGFPAEYLEFVHGLAGIKVVRS
jgi:glycosyltransferase involved in cell wall biosynthesis